MKDTVACESGYPADEDGLEHWVTKAEIVELSKLDRIALVRDLGLVWFAIAVTLIVATRLDSIQGYRSDSS